MQAAAFLTIWLSANSPELWLVNAKSAAADSHISGTTAESNRLSQRATRQQQRPGPELIPIKCTTGPNPVKIWSQSNRQLVPIWSRTGPNMIQAWSQSGPELVPIWPRPGPHLVQTWSQSGPALVPIWSRSGPHLVQIWSQSGPDLVPIWSRSGPNLVQSWSHSVPDFVPVWCGPGPDLVEIWARSGPDLIPVAPGSRRAARNACRPWCTVSRRAQRMCAWRTCFERGPRAHCAREARAKWALRGGAGAPNRLTRRL